MPLIARDLLHGGAQLYGIMLELRLGAVIGRSYRRGAQAE